MAAIRQVCNDNNGCFMANNHPKLEDFDGPFGTSHPPRKIQFSDIDGTVEVDGYFLFTEFKSHYDMSGAQRRYYERLTQLNGGRKCVALYVVGDNPNRRPEAYCECINGQWTSWTRCTQETLRDKIQAFATDAKRREREGILAAREARISVAA